MANDDYKDAKELISVSTQAFDYEPNASIQEEEERSRIQRMRDFLRKIVLSKYFEYCVFMLIAINCVALATVNFEHTTGPKWEHILMIIDFVISILFTIEMCLKLTALGFKRFFSSAWNVYDFLIVIACLMGIIVDMMGDSSHSSLIKLSRVGRLTRILSASKNMRILVTAILSSTRRLFYVVILLGCFIFFATSVSQEFFRGSFRHRCHDYSSALGMTIGTIPMKDRLNSSNKALMCRYSSMPDDFDVTTSKFVETYLMEKYNYSSDKLLNSTEVKDLTAWLLKEILVRNNYDTRFRISDLRAGYIVSNKTEIENAVGLEHRTLFSSYGHLSPIGGLNVCPYDELCIISQTPQYDLTNFDSIAASVALIYNIMTALDGWSYIIYFLAEAQGWWVATIFFGVLLTIGNFFLLNLPLVVIIDAFQHSYLNKMVEGAALETAMGFQMIDDIEEEAPPRIGANTTTTEEMTIRDRVNNYVQQKHKEDRRVFEFIREEDENYKGAKSRRDSKRNSIHSCNEYIDACSYRHIQDNYNYNDNDNDDSVELKRHYTPPEIVGGSESTVSRPGSPFCTSYVVNDENINNNINNNGNNIHQMNLKQKLSIVFGGCPLLEEISDTTSPNKNNSIIRAARPNSPIIRPLDTPTDKLLVDYKESTHTSITPDGSVHTNTVFYCCLPGIRHIICPEVINIIGRKCLMCRRNLRHYIVGTKWFRILNVCILVCNLIFESTIYKGMSDTHRVVIETSNYFFISFYLLEVILKMMAYPYFIWSRDRFNFFDAGVTIGSCIELMFQNNSNTFSSLRSLRLLRIVTLVEPLRYTVTTILAAFRGSLSLLVLVFVFIFLFAMFGLQLYSGTYCGLDTSSPYRVNTTLCDNVPRYNFDNIGYAFQTVFSIVSSEGWRDMMVTAETATSRWSILFFCTCHFFVGYLMLNLFVAVMLNSGSEVKLVNYAISSLSRKKNTPHISKVDEDDMHEKVSNTRESSKEVISDRDHHRGDDIPLSKMALSVTSSSAREYLDQTDNVENRNDEDGFKTTDIVSFGEWSDATKERDRESLLPRNRNLKQRHSVTFSGPLIPGQEEELQPVRDSKTLEFKTINYEAHDVASVISSSDNESDSDYDCIDIDTEFNIRALAAQNLIKASSFLKGKNTNTSIKDQSKDDDIRVTMNMAADEKEQALLMISSKPLKNKELLGLHWSTSHMSNMDMGKSMTENRRALPFLKRLHLRLREISVIIYTTPPMLVLSAMGTLASMGYLCVWSPVMYPDHPVRVAGFYVDIFVAVIYILVLVVKMVYFGVITDKNQSKARGTKRKSVDGYTNNNIGESGEPNTYRRSHYSYVHPTQKQQKTTSDINLTDSFNYGVDDTYKLLATYHREGVSNFIFPEKTFFENYWNTFEFIFTIISIGPVIVQCFLICVQKYDGGRSSSISRHSNSIINWCRVFRCLNVWTFVRYFPHFNILFRTLIRSIRTLRNALVITILVWYIFATLGLQLFGGRMNACTSYRPHNYDGSDNLWGDVTYKPPYIQTKSECLERGFHWTSPSMNFDNIGAALVTSFDVVTVSNWHFVMYIASDIRGPDLAPLQNSFMIAPFYFISLVVIMAYFMINFFKSALIESYFTTKAEIEKKFTNIRRKRERAATRANKMRAKIIAEAQQQLQVLRQEAVENELTNFATKEDYNNNNNNNYNNVSESDVNESAQTRDLTEILSAPIRWEDGIVGVHPSTNVRVGDHGDIIAHTDEIQPHGKSHVNTTGNPHNSSGIHSSATVAPPTNICNAQAPDSASEIHARVRMLTNTLSSLTTINSGAAKKFKHYHGDWVLCFPALVKKNKNVLFRFRKEAINKNDHDWDEDVKEEQVSNYQHIDKFVMMLTNDERRFFKMYRYALYFIRPPLILHYNYDSCYGKIRLRLRMLIRSYYTEVFLFCVAVFHVFFEFSEFITDNPISFKIYLVMDIILTVFFCIVMIIKMMVYGFRAYFDQQRNVVDLVVNCLTVSACILCAVEDNSMYWRITRTLFFFRLVRLSYISFVYRGLLVQMQTFVDSAKSFCSVFVLLFLVMYTFTAISMIMFGLVKHTDRDSINNWANFAQFDRAIYTLVRIATTDNWNHIMHNCGIKPPHCDPNIGECGSPVFSRLFFMVLIAVGNWVGLNLFTAVLMDEFVMSENDGSFELQEGHVRGFQRLWKALAVSDKATKTTLNFNELMIFIAILPAPLGVSGKLKNFKSKKGRQAALREQIERDIALTTQPFAKIVSGCEEYTLAQRGLSETFEKEKEYSEGAKGERNKNKGDRENNTGTVTALRLLLQMTTVPLYSRRKVKCNNNNNDNNRFVGPETKIAYEYYAYPDDIFDALIRIHHGTPLPETAERIITGERHQRFRRMRAINTQHRIARTIASNTSTFISLKRTTNEALMNLSQAISDPEEHNNSGKTQQDSTSNLEITKLANRLRYGRPISVALMAATVIIQRWYRYHKVKTAS